MDKVVTLSDGSKLGLRATALTPRLYRFKMGRDMIVDLNQLRNAYEKAEKAKTQDMTEEEMEQAQLTVTDLTIFENVAFIMARQYDKSLPETPEEWLDSMDTVFTVYELMPHILELWQAGQKTTSIPKKK